MTETIYLMMLICCHTVGYVFLLSEGNQYAGAATIAYIMAVIFTVIAFYVAKLQSRRLGVISSRFQFRIDHRKFDYFILALIIATLYFSIKTGVGVAEAYVTNKYSQIFSILNINSIIWIYYFCQREYYSNKIFWINIALYLILRVLQGWSGVILFLFFFELYFFCKRRGFEIKKISIRYTALILLATLGILALGGLLYSYVFVFKYSIRGNNTAQLLENNLTWGQGINRLVRRISYMDTSAKSIINSERICNLYTSQEDTFLEIKAFFRPLVQKSIMPDKLFRSLGSCIYSGVSGLYNINVTDSAGIGVFAYIVYKINDSLFWVWLLFYITLYLLTIDTFKLFEEYDHQFDYLIFFLSISIIDTGNLETLFGQTYFKMIFLIPVLFLLGIIRIYYYPKRYRRKA